MRKGLGEETIIEQVGMGRLPSRSWMAAGLLGVSSRRRDPQRPGEAAARDMSAFKSNRRCPRSLQAASLSRFAGQNGVECLCPRRSLLKGMGFRQLA